MSDPSASDPTGLGNVANPNNPSETFENTTITQRDEHIARLQQEIEDLRGELNRMKDLTNLAITLHSPSPGPKNTVPNPPRFPSLDSPVPEHFPPQDPPPTNNNLPPITPANPQRPLPTNTPYVPPPNPPPMNPQSQPVINTSYAPTNPPSQPPVNTPYNPLQPPVQNTPTVQAYPVTQHVSGADIAIPIMQSVPPVYAEEAHTFTNPISVKFQPEVDQYEEMEKDAKAKADDMLAKEIRRTIVAIEDIEKSKIQEKIPIEEESLPRSSSIMTFSKSTTKATVGDELTVGVKNPSMAVIEADDNKVLKDCTKISATSDVEPEKTLEI
ncbi:hypothetical protein A4A49_39912 [Nicotiana attenuata]|uniref:Uncharacterized protein n=1 Tax=Nicotiana attenuata TaxID=49451 RepID=A0A314KQW6_NICAT|nr:hypothetical protein A4A49_39912 [Nicotiana attenuata]